MQSLPIYPVELKRLLWRDLEAGFPAMRCLGTVEM